MEIKPTNTVVVAGAGAGKTYALVHEYIFSLLGLDGSGIAKSPSSILAVTFTDKAAAEMRARVSSKLLALAYDDDENDCIRQRSHQYKMALPSKSELEALAQELPSAPISTFHSFCGQLLRDYCVPAGIDGNYVLLDPREEKQIMGTIATEVILDALAREDSGVADLVSRFLVGGADDSEGLSNNIVEIYQEICEHGFSPDMVPLALGHTTNSSIHDLTNEVWQYFAAFSAPSDTVAAKLVQAKASFNQLLSAMSADSSAEREIRMSRHFQDLRIPLKGRFGVLDQRKNLIEAIVALGSRLVADIAVEDARVFRSLLADFSHRVAHFKDQRSSYGFSDLLSRTRMLLRTNCEVRKEVKNSLTKILVDEFQDTSPLQEDLVALLAEDLIEEKELSSGQRAMGTVQLGENRLFIVGDPKQSIYGFRGADAGLFGHSLNTVVKGSDSCRTTGEQQTLSMCRRSQGAVVELVNVVARATLSLSEDGVPFTEADQLSALRPSLGQAGAVWQAQVASAEGLSDDLALVLAGEIKNLLTAAPAETQLPQLGVVKPGDICILVRRIKSATPLIRALAKQNIATVLFGGDGFYQQPEVIDAIAALKLMIDPEDELATLTVLRSPLVLLPDEDFTRLVSGIPNWQRGLSWEKIVKHACYHHCGEAERLRIEQLELVLRKARRHLHSWSLGALLKIILQESNYWDRLTVEEHAERRRANLLKLIDLGSQLKNNPFGDIEKWWKMLASPPKESLACLKQSEDAVKIMTIHQSKGLEFKVVILADIFSSPPNETGAVLFDPAVGLAVSALGRPIAGCGPSTTDERLLAPTPIDAVRQRKKQRVEAELARILYVAMTRARDALFIMDATMAGEKPVERGISLRRLLMLGRTANKVVFDQLLPTMALSSCNYAVQSHTQSFHSAVDICLLAPQIPIRTRIMASTLGDSASFTSQTARSTSSAQLGSLAHYLIAMSWLHLHRHPELSDLESYAFMRAVQKAGKFSLSEKSETVLRRCLVTIRESLTALYAQAPHFTFEEHLSYAHGSNVVAEGKADLVARGPQGIYLLDFKSSAAAAAAPQTKLQLYCYAQALAQLSPLPIYLTSCVIGSKHELSWECYQPSELLLTELNLIQHRHSAVDDGLKTR